MMYKQQNYIHFYIKKSTLHKLNKKYNYITTSNK